MTNILDGKYITAADQEALVSVVKGRDEFKRLVKVLEENGKINVDTLQLTVAYEFDQLNFENKVSSVQVITLQNTEDKVLLNYINVKADGQENELFTGKVVTKEGTLKGFEVAQDEVRLISTAEYTGQLEEVIKFDAVNNDNYVPGEISEQLDFSLGSWCLDNEDAGKLYRHCGPGCGDGLPLGGGTPINSIDTCCRAHDRCWATYGSGDKCCDKTLASCIDPYQSQDYWSWLQINSYFQPRGWLC